MDFYVVAFSDRPWRRRKIHGRWYQSVKLGQVYAIGERRTVAPALEDDELRHQHDVVRSIAGGQTILPVRFGAQTTSAALERLAGPHEETLKRGLDEVRDRVQMTVRFVGLRPRPRSAGTGISGREYLERRRASTALPLTSEAMAFLASLERIASQHRVEAGSGSLLATAYHLVPCDQVDRYLVTAGDAGRVGAVVTGPFPPFAFTPAII